MRTAKLLSNLIESFMDSVDMHGWSFHVAMPQVMAVEKDSSYFPRDAIVLFEPYLANFEVFNTASGWANSARRSHVRLLQALSHYSYVKSDHHFLVAGLQGSVDEENRVVMLSSPTILTPDGIRFGCVDTGQGAIDTFLKHHKCFSVCP